MTLDSFLPPDLLVAPEEQPPAQEELLLGHRILMGRYEKGAFCISRVISTDPADYLEPRFSPGTRIWTNGDRTVC